LRKPESTEGLVRIIHNDQEVIVEQSVDGPVEIFFAPDETHALVITDDLSMLIDLTTQKSSEITLPVSVKSILGWY
jgi:hypothetical protein